MATTLARLRSRAPTLKTFVRRALTNKRNVQYDLLPLLGSIQSRNLMSGLLRWGLPRTRDFSPSPEARALQGQLVQRGYTDTIPLITPAQVADLLRYFRDQPCWDPWRPHLGDFAWDAPPSPETNLGIYRNPQIVNAPHAFAIFNHPLMLDLAELYLGCKPTVDNLNCWWSYPERSVSKGTQRYHRDWDNIRGFKLFIYLTDVEEETGPHCFIAGSHDSDLLMETRAMSDEEVEREFGPAALRKFCGPAGTCFVADTFGVHKGLLPRSGTRLVLSAQYNLTPSPHGPSQPIAQGDGALDPYVNRIFIKG